MRVIWVRSVYATNASSYVMLNIPLEISGEIRIEPLLHIAFQKNINDTTQSKD